MKTVLKKSMLLCSSLSVALILVTTACNKKDDATKKDTTPQTVTPELPADGDALFVAVQSSSPSPTAFVNPLTGKSESFDVEFGTGVVVFKENGKADKIVLNGQELKLVNGSYTFTPDLTSIGNPSSPSSGLGITFNGKAEWEVTNPTFSETINRFPKKPVIMNNPTTIDLTQDFVVLTDNQAYSPNMLYTIVSNGEVVSKERDSKNYLYTGRAVEGVTFTPEELKVLKADDNALLQATAYFLTSKNIDGKNYYFVTQFTLSKNIKIK